jgi:hypothetical protein
MHVPGPGSICRQWNYQRSAEPLVLRILHIFWAGLCGARRATRAWHLPSNSQLKGSLIVMFPRYLNVDVHYHRAMLARCKWRHLCCALKPTFTPIGASSDVSLGNARPAGRATPSRARSRVAYFAIRRPITEAAIAAALPTPAARMLIEPSEMSLRHTNCVPT